MSIGYALKQAQSLLHVRMGEALDPLGLTVSQYSCLFHLQAEPGISASELARRTFVTRQSMNVMLQQLVDRSLVARPVRAGTGRALPAELTPDGRRALDAAQHHVDRVERRMLEGIGPGQTDALAAGLAACIAALGPA